MLQIGHPMGLFNRLDVIATGYVLADQRGEKEIEVFWPLVERHMPVAFHELFTRLPAGRVVNREIDPTMLAGYFAAAGKLPENYRDSELYGARLRELMNSAVPEVQAEVAAFVERNFQRATGVTTIGIHIRRSERPHPICEYAKPLRYYQAAIEAFPRPTRFLVCTDSQEAFQWLKRRFGDRIFQREKHHDTRESVAGVREGLIDILLLSQCSAIIGTAGSSFSRASAIVGRRPIMLVKTRPNIPAGWPHFSRVRWLWSYRHFFVESTFWRCWLYYHVRPYAICIPKIPARCVRIARSCATSMGIPFPGAPPSEIPRNH